jgi:class 3 adenylate cyclase
MRPAGTAQSPRELARYGRGVPIFLDRHDAPDATADAVAQAHVLDIAAQGKHGVHYHTYWFDPAQGTVFCLAEGPTREAVEEVHREAHGMMPTSIMELDSTTSLNAFLGSPPMAPLGTAYEAPAMRAIVFTDIRGSVAQVHELGDDGHMQLLREHDDIVRSQLSANNGREVKHTGDGIMASFVSVTACLAFAIEVQRRLHERNESAEHRLNVSIGVSAGEPITGDHEDLFGAAVQLAARLCASAQAGDITVSQAVREFSVGKSFRFEDRGELDLKGMPEPVRAYLVRWRD